MADWKMVRIGDVCKTGSGSTPLKANREYYEGGTIPWLQSGEVAQGEIFHSKNFITEAGLQNSAAKIFPPNTVLVAMYGATAGQVGILRFPASTNQAVCGIYPNAIFLPEFLYYALLVKQAELIASATGNAQPNISQIKIKNTEIPSLPISEQKRIVEILDEAFEGIDTAIANTEKNLANTRKLFGNYIETIFSSDDKNWTNCLIGEVCTLKSGTTVPVGIEKSDGDIPYVKVAEMTMEENLDGIYTSIRFLNYADIKKNWIIPKGATIFPKRGGAILTNKKRILLRDVCLDLNIMAVIPSDKIMPEFLYIYFLNVDMRKLGNGSSIPQINNVDIAPLKFAFPSNKEEQLKVIEEFKVIEEGYNLLLKSYEHKLNLLSELKKSILQKAFRGELTPSSDALAEVAA
jgi:type I restriction enzyme S subunit